MSPLPELIIRATTPFANMFSNPVLNHVRVLLAGAILCNGPRTVASILRVMGLDQENNFGKYHRVLSRARWSGLHGAKILFGLLLKLIPHTWPVIIGIDETIERRNGRRINAKGVYRDAVRSSRSQVAHCFGLKWISMMLIIPVPWSRRLWALPFLTVLAPSKKANDQAKKRHKTTIDWAVLMVRIISQWAQNRWCILIGDGAYACVHFALFCQHRGVSLVSRLRLDSRLFDFPGPIIPGRRGPKPKKGKQLPSLNTLIDDPAQPWVEREISWYNGKRKRIKLLTNVCLWHTQGKLPVRIRWVLVRHVDGNKRTEAFFSTDTELAAESIIEYYVWRWGVEVTFEESRRHLGLETQRQWSDQAIARTTPMLLAMFTIIFFMANHLLQTVNLIPRGSAWYAKQEPTFSDMLSLVRRWFWSEKYFVNSAKRDNPVVFGKQEWNILLDQLAAVA